MGKNTLKAPGSYAVHLACGVVLMVAALLWLVTGASPVDRGITLGKLCFLTVVCFIGIHLANSIPTQVQATPPAQGP